MNFQLNRSAWNDAKDIIKSKWMEIQLDDDDDERMLHLNL